MYVGLCKIKAYLGHFHLCNPTIAKIFQLNSNKPKADKNLSLNLSAFVYHAAGINLQKKFAHCSISASVVPSSIHKLWAPLATILMKKKFKEFGDVLYQFELRFGRNF